MRCPGQDWSYWKDEVVFEAPCPKCDAPVEFFRDEGSGRCPKCGHRFRNPKVSFDCAKWCAFADECLGFVPEREEAPDPGKGAVASRLILAIKEQFGADQARVAHALRIFRHASGLLSAEGGDPRVVLAAALLLETGRDEGQGLAKVKQILQHVGLDEDTSDCVCHLIEGRRTDTQLDTIEFKVVADAEFLAKAAAAKDAGGDPRRLIEIAEERLKTESGKQRARLMLQTPPAHSGNEGDAP